MSEVEPTAMSHEDLAEAIETSASHVLHGMLLSHEQHVEVCAEIGRLAAGQIADRTIVSCAHVREVVADVVARAIREAPFIEDLKERLSAALVDDIADRAAERLGGLRAPQSVTPRMCPDWARPGWILSARVIPTLTEAARAEHGPSHAVTRALTAWNDYGELAAADLAVLTTWAQEHQASPDGRLRERAAAIEKFLVALEARAAFLTPVTSGWISHHDVEVDVVVIRRACEMAIQHRARDGSAPHVTISADVLLALTKYARLLCDGVLVERAGAGRPVSAWLAELAARGPVVGGDGAPDADGSVVQPAPQNHRWCWIEADDADAQVDPGHVREVYAAAVAWRRHVNLVTAQPHTQALLAAIDAAIVSEETVRKETR